MVQLTNQGNHGVGLIVAMNHAAAKKMVDGIKQSQGKKLSVAAVGAVEGETLAMKIATAILEHGATGCYVTDDGDNMRFFKAPPVRE